MPELPDVELRKRYLDATALQRRIEHAKVPQSRMLQVTADHLRGQLKGRRLVASRRHGKYLFGGLDSGAWLVLHFGMTGWLEAFEDPDDEPEHTWLRLDLDDGFHVAYVCPRQFGEIDLCRDVDTFVSEHDLGPDGLALDEDGFLGRLEGRRGAVKPTLMYQQVLAGLGNVWVDEILFQHPLHPERPIPELGDEERRGLFRTMRRVVQEGIDRRVDPDDMPDSWLLGHREDGAECPRCGGEIRRITVSGRAGYHCPEHQQRAG